MATGARFREFLKKYGKVALGVHFSVSAASITGLYVAIRNNVDVESLLEKVGLSGVSKPEETSQTTTTATIHQSQDGFVVEDWDPSRVLPSPPEKRIRTAELAASSGGALALAVLCNKALFPVRVPITVALTPAVSRFLARQRIIKNHV